jgi:hypothetical protein
MGNQQTKQKEGVSWAAIRDTIQPLDLVLFSGADVLSSLIKFLERENLTPVSGSSQDAGAFSHVGLVVTKAIFDHPKVLPGRLYVMESTISGRLGNGVNNIDGKWHLGVQIRDLDELIEAYDKSARTAVAIARLKSNPARTSVLLSQHSSEQTEVPRHLREQFAMLYNEYNGITYDSNCWSLAASIYPCLRPCRPLAETTTSNWLFCSELVATINIRMGIFDKKVNPKNVTPMDLVGFDRDAINDGGVPQVYEAPIRVLSKYWATAIGTKAPHTTDLVDLP